jgi:multiple sugar transport system substrate-binding protein
MSSFMDQMVDYRPPAPLGSTEFDHKVMRPIADQLAFGKVTIKAG